jgi:hypothetical protein
MMEYIHYFFIKLFFLKIIIDKTIVFIGFENCLWNGFEPYNLRDGKDIGSKIW